MKNCLKSTRGPACAADARTAAAATSRPRARTVTRIRSHLTALSLLPDAARAAGISFEALCERILEDALQRRPATGPSRVAP